MTRQEAQAEAVRRWGEFGAVLLSRSRYTNLKPFRYRVGVCNYGERISEALSFQYAMGVGSSWEEAFANASRVDADARSSR